MLSTITIETLATYIKMMVNGYENEGAFVVREKLNIGFEHFETNSRDAFCGLVDTMSDKGMPYPFRKECYNAAQVLYSLFEDLQKEFEHCPDEVAYANRFKRRDRNIIHSLSDGINYDTPNEPGLYFLGETHFNPITHEEFYCVKIGRASNLRRRLKEYDTHNPMLWRIDYSVDNEEMEHYYHHRLYDVAIATCNHNKEWFFVDRQTYLEMCEKGFSYFD